MITENDETKMADIQSVDILSNSPMVRGGASMGYIFLGTGSSEEYMDNLVEGLATKTIDDCDSCFWDFSDGSCIALCAGIFFHVYPPIPLRILK